MLHSLPSWLAMVQHGFSAQGTVSSPLTLSVDEASGSFSVIRQTKAAATASRTCGYTTTDDEDYCKVGAAAYLDLIEHVIPTDTVSGSTMQKWQHSRPLVPVGEATAAAAAATDAGPAAGAVVNGSERRNDVYRLPSGRMQGHHSCQTGK